jgi:hypothetical protein
MCRFIARLFQGEFTLPQPFRTGPLAILNQLQRRLNSQGRDRTQHFRRHRRIDAHIAECDALLVAGVVHFGIADITNMAPRMVQYLELASAVPATEQSHEKPSALAHRACHHRSLHVGVACDNLLVAIILLP